MIIPEGAILTIGSSGDVVVDSIEESFDILEFDREEYSNQRLNASPNAQGAIPSIQYAYGNVPVEIDNVCSPQAILSFLPDDPDQIKKKFDIKRYRISTKPSDPDVVKNIYDRFVLDRKKITKFNNYLAKHWLNLKYSDLYALRSETFSYLTSGGIDLTGSFPSNFFSATNVLITEFTSGIDLAVKNSDGTTTVLKSCSFTVENRVLGTASSLS